MKHHQIIVCAVFACALITGPSVAQQTHSASSNVFPLDLRDSHSGFTLGYLAGAGGSLIGDASQEVMAGASGETVTAAPEAGAVFHRWSDGVLTASRKETNVQSDMSVTAIFRSQGGVDINWYAEHDIFPRVGQTWADLDGFDATGKGMTLREEFLAGTDPGNPSSRFEAFPPVRDGTRLAIHFHPNLSGRLYTLYVSTDLMDWKPVSGMVNVPGGAGPLVDSTPPIPDAFYRIGVIMP